jgi:hypothetical protein
MADETDDKEPKPAPKRRENSEKAIGLEMARLFGLNPKLMMAPKSTPEPPPESADDDEEDGHAD